MGDKGAPAKLPLPQILRWASCLEPAFGVYAVTAELEWADGDVSSCTGVTILDDGRL